MKCLNDYFDKIYCINLDRATERWEKCVEQFEKYNVKVERFSAIEPECSVNGVPKGHIGVMRSNCQIIEMAKKQKIENILILEDDFLFVDNFNEKLNDVYNKIPKNWDFIYFGGNHLGPIFKVNDMVYKMTHSYAIHTVAIKNTMYDKILNELRKEKKPGDVSYAELMPSCNAYVMIPHLSTQRPGFSYIENEFRDYDYCLKK